MPKSDLKAHIISDGKALTKEYDETITRKIEQQHSILIVTHEDLTRYKDIASLIFSKESKSCEYKIMYRYFNELRLSV